MRALWNTLVLALVTSAATILLAVMISWFVVRRSRAADGLSHYLATVSFLPQCVPSIVIGLAFIFVYVRFPIPIYGTLWIIALAMTTRYLAYSSRTMTSALMQVHGELEEASQMSRAPWTRTLRRITAAALGAGYDQCVFLGGGARDAGVIDGSDAVQSGDGGRLDDDLEHVAKRPHHGCRSLGGDLDFAFRHLAARRPAVCATCGAALTLESCPVF